MRRTDPPIAECTQHAVERAGLVGEVLGVTDSTKCIRDVRVVVRAARHSARKENSQIVVDVLEVGGFKFCLEQVDESPWVFGERPLNSLEKARTTYSRFGEPHLV